jgi:hypothetical protein
VDVTVMPDLAPDAEPIKHAMQCAVCGERSSASEQVEAAQDWAARHAGETRGHFTYREVITRPWRAGPAEEALS